MLVICRATGCEGRRWFTRTRRATRFTRRQGSSGSRRLTWKIRC